MSKKYRIRLINFPSMGEKRWCRMSLGNNGYRITTKDINEAFRIREEKQRTSSKIQYIYQVEEYFEGMA